MPESQVIAVALMSTSPDAVARVAISSRVTLELLTVEAHPGALRSVTAASYGGIPVQFLISDAGDSIGFEVPAEVDGSAEFEVSGPMGATSITLQTLTAHASWTYTACPEITDSTTRLYSAYFLREPDQAGFEFWLDNYSSGLRNLDSMSGFFSVSAEFQETYGGLSNAEFIDLVYQNVLGRAGDTEGRAFWISQLDSGAMSRGVVMINFSESSEYVIASRTVKPLSGYFNWYPQGTTWQCHRGQAEMQLGVDKHYVDFLVHNDGLATANYTIDFRYQGQWFANDPVELGYRWHDIYFNSDVGDITGLRVSTDNNVRWLAVDSPLPIPANRSGWRDFSPLNGAP